MKRLINLLVSCNSFLLNKNGQFVKDRTSLAQEYEININHLNWHGPRLKEKACTIFSRHNDPDLHRPISKPIEKNSKEVSDQVLRQMMKIVNSFSEIARDEQKKKFNEKATYRRLESWPQFMPDTFASGEIFIPNLTFDKQQIHDLKAKRKEEAKKYT